MPPVSPLLLGLELSGTGAHPASWRRADSRAEDVFGAAYWVDALRAAEDAGIDLAFVPDSFSLPTAGVPGRLDAVAVAARAAAATRRIGLPGANSPVAQRFPAPSRTGRGTSHRRS
ncbi:LLM class flavin-dependent oxidoreductase, partial [Nocardia sp. NPDC004722]